MLWTPSYSYTIYSRAMSPNNSCIFLMFLDCYLAVMVSVVSIRIWFYYVTVTKMKLQLNGTKGWGQRPQNLGPRTNRLAPNLLCFIYLFYLLVLYALLRL